jgi:membrane-associated phospholipid phosphatase
LHRTLYLLAVIFAVLSGAALAIDLPVIRLLDQHSVPGDLRKLVTLAEVFAHGIGAACILLTVYVLDWRHRRRVLRIAACAFGAGMLANLGKFTIARYRPRVWDDEGPWGSVWDTFCGWLPALTGSPSYEGSSSDIQSFPSGHTAVAVGLAIGLSRCYPQGRWLFASFAVLAAFQRIQSTAHFPSDTLAGAALACFCCGVCFDPRLLGKRFDRFELAACAADAL